MPEKLTFLKKKLTFLKKKVKKGDKGQVPVHQQTPSEIWEEFHQGLRPCLYPANCISRDNDGGYRVSEG